MKRPKYNFAIGERFGKWLIVADVQKDKSGHRQHLCQCDCSFQSTVTCSNLGRGLSTQCKKCATKQSAQKIREKNSLVGRQYGLLTVLERVSKRHKSDTYHWLCQCDCGNQHTVCHSNLITNKTNSCGCARPRGNEHGLWKGHGEISRSRWHSIVRAAAKRNIAFDVRIEEVWDLFLSQDRKCMLTGWDLIMHIPLKVYGTASLDRIDSKLGYTMDNVQWVHKDANRAKSDLEQHDFIAMCCAIADRYRGC